MSSLDGRNEPGGRVAREHTSHDALRAAALPVAATDAVGVG